MAQWFSDQKHTIITIGKDRTAGLFLHEVEKRSLSVLFLVLPLRSFGLTTIAVASGPNAEIGVTRSAESLRTTGKAKRTFLGRGLTKTSAYKKSIEHGRRTGGSGGASQGAMTMLSSLDMDMSESKGCLSSGGGTIAPHGSSEVGLDSAIVHIQTIAAKSSKSHVLITNSNIQFIFLLLSYIYYRIATWLVFTSIRSCF